jgi:hypothetical protein
MLKSFVKAEGVLALVQALKESRCPLTLGYELELIVGLIHQVDPSTGRRRGRKLADNMFESGAGAVW